MECNTQALKLVLLLWVPCASLGLPHLFLGNFAVKLLRFKALMRAATREHCLHQSWHEICYWQQCGQAFTISRQVCWWEVTLHLQLPRLYILNCNGFEGIKKSVLELLMHPGTSKFPLGMGWLNCHFKFYILPLNQLFHLNKKVLYSGMEMQLLQVALQHVDLLLAIYSFKEKIP